MGEGRQNVMTDFLAHLCRCLVSSSSYASFSVCLYSELDQNWEKIIHFSKKNSTLRAPFQYRLFSQCNKGRWVHFDFKLHFSQGYALHRHRRFQSPIAYHSSLLFEGLIFLFTRDFLDNFRK